MRRTSSLIRNLAVVAAAPLAIALTACSDSSDGVQVYEVIVPPNAAKPTQPASPHGGSMPSLGGSSMLPPAAPASNPIEWDVPAEWTKINNANSFDRARYAINDENGSPLAMITVTAGIKGAVGPNVNRWRGQLGLDSLSEEELIASAIKVPVGEETALVFDMATADRSRQTIAAIVPVPGDTYFFKISASGDIVDAQRDAFMNCLRSIRVKGEK
ncbi:hypothetical protein [Sulfuriroseicoccus oceanibius]|uniref:Lipoprotein n=1 Tax=Sulfuriroseicoccus oceanibius TaxID=2707525 RepID=A0A6B3L869_9BACT|nr:hypothetical protein [Sulfuriroseicoccus oceanibius]QQL46033.1 hypothetical protein G3M56_005485 [Sulfuriroseicoccus oceanibius]